MLKFKNLEAPYLTDEEPIQPFEKYRANDCKDDTHVVKPVLQASVRKVRTPTLRQNWLMFTVTWESCWLQKTTRNGLMYRRNLPNSTVNLARLKR